MIVAMIVVVYLVMLLLLIGVVGRQLARTRPDSVVVRWLSRIGTVNIGPIVVILLIIGVLVAILLQYRGHELTAGDLAQVLLLLGLVTVTAVYAASTSRQAEANRRMAEEMKEQRHGAVRPIVDILWPSTGIRAIPEITAAAYGKFESLECSLRNIGLGPALDVSSLIQLPDASCRQHSFGTMGVNKETGLYRLSTRQEDGSSRLLVEYYDVYGRRCESRREVTVDKAGMQVRPLEVEHFPWE
jgi:hypothetical protein